MEGRENALRQSAVDRLRASMRPKVVSVSDRMTEVRSKFVETTLEDDLADMIDLMKASLVGRVDQDEHQILFVHGESHAGKTTLLKRALLNDPAFQPYEEDYKPIMPLARMSVFAPSSLRNLAVDGLNQMLGYPVKADLKRTVAWPEFRDKLEERQVLFLWLDEAQNLLHVNDPNDIYLIANALVGLVQREKWQVRLILSGLPDLVKLLDYGTIGNRSLVLPVPSIEIPEDPADANPKRDDKQPDFAAIVRGWVREVVEVHAGVRLADFLGGDFPARLVHACGKNFGSIIRLTRNAVEVAFLRHDWRSTEPCIVLKDDFGTAYKNVSGVPNLLNVFHAPNWKDLPLGLARIRSEDDVEAPTADVRPAKKVKALRAGERRK